MIPIAGTKSRSSGAEALRRPQRDRVAGAAIGPTYHGARSPRLASSLLGAVGRDILLSRTDGGG
jgi:hypothetical protein